MKVRYSEPSLKQLRKIGKPEAKRILEYMKEIEKLENPKNKGKPEAKKQRQGFGRKLE